MNRDDVIINLIIIKNINKYIELVKNENLTKIVQYIYIYIYFFFLKINIFQPKIYGEFIIEITLL